MKGSTVEPSATSSENDFDFLIGKWKIKNKKLKTRLNNCTEWTAFEATGEMEKILNGFGNTDNFFATIAEKPFEGRTFRLFNRRAKLWSIHWVDSTTGVLDTPVVGSFEGDIGKFHTKDVFDGHEIEVMFHWDKANPDEPVWSQAFSKDGKTWEWNWYMYFSRNDDLNSNQIVKVVELRNYLLKPNSLDQFQNYFQGHFIESQNILNGYTLGQFKIDDVDNRFFWLRGFNDMASRLCFLKSFYDKSTAWKKYGMGANELMLDSSQVHLVRPLNRDGDWRENSHGIIRNGFLSKSKIITIGYYFSQPGRLGELIDLFRGKYLTMLPTPEKIDFTLWITEGARSEFRHPVIQDNNLLLVIEAFKGEVEYRNHPDIERAIPEIAAILDRKEALVLRPF
ncbi:MAG TPA: hypothetical protein VKQ08_00065 [Cyclobacteriaceae bacterium]|nr:hypothetical protein [Cyclobacteriaceae bacterium]